MLQYGLKLFVMALLLLLTACSVTIPAAAPTTAPAAPNADAIAGVWVGTMSFSDIPDTIEVEASIPEGCSPGDACGTSTNKTDNCTFEFAFEGIEDNTYIFKNLRTISGDCPASSSVLYYTPQPDGKLYRRLEAGEDWFGEATLSRQRGETVK